MSQVGEPSPDNQEKYSLTNGEITFNKTAYDPAEKSSQSGNEAGGASQEQEKIKEVTRINIYPKERKKHKVWFWWGWRPIGGIVAFLVNVALVYITWDSLNTAKDALSDARRKDSIQSAEDKIKRHIDSVRFDLDSSLIESQIKFFKTQEKQFLSINRPWLIREAVGDDTAFFKKDSAYNREGKPNSTFVDIENVGNQPCKIISVKHRARMGQADKIGLELKPTKTQYDYTAIVAPGKGFSVLVETDEILTNYDIQSFNEGEINMFYIIEIVYQDVISNRTFKSTTIEKLFFSRGVFRFLPLTQSDVELTN